MKFLSKLLRRKENTCDRFQVAWLDMHLNKIFAGYYKKLNSYILSRLIDTTPALADFPAERFFAEMLGAQLNLFGFVCDRLDPKLNHAATNIIHDNYNRASEEPYTSALGEAFTALNEMAQGYATNPVLGHRTIALAVATRLNVLHSHGAVKFLTEQFQKLENDWEEDFRIVLLEEYDKKDPAQLEKAAYLKGKFRQHILDHAIKDLAAQKPHKASERQKSAFIS